MNCESTFQKESFVFYKSFYESIKLLPKKTQLDIYIAICEFSLYGNLIELPPKTMAYLTLIIPQIQANFRRREAGKMGGRPRKEKNLGFESEKPMVSESENHWFPNEKPNANVNANANANVNANENVNVNGPVFPTLSEVMEFAQSEGIECKVEDFFAFYSTPDDKGRVWVDSNGKPVTNWRRKLRTWANLEKANVTAERSKENKRNTIDNYKVEGIGHPQLSEINMSMDDFD